MNIEKYTQNAQQIVMDCQNIAVAEGHMRPQHKGTATNLVKYGHTVDVKDKISQLRAELGLPEIPPTVLANEKAKADLDVILKATGFDKIVEE